MGSPSSTNAVRRVTRIVGGGVLILVGLFGLVMPVMPGWLFIVPGLTLWSSEFRWAARLRHRTVAFVRRHRDTEPSAEDRSIRDRHAA